MKKILLTLALSFTTLVSAHAAHPQCGETELAKIMGEMKDDMKAIKGAAKSNDTIKVSALAQDLLITVRKADDYVPLVISDKKELTAAQQAEFDDYKKGMAALEDAVTELTMAKTADEQKAALGKIGKSAKKGHKAFKMDCDD
ncbi:cytochrome b562 [Thalassomonas sp. M1454]|uniref:cytochrome b562 n=1 Tax=Thalassomonas sp. M1454 TaxID=2594477 RepID=UPI00117F8CFB|nr:cytochrome b562 [Thalassomonas sp. M1454]TRX52824.1 cytochrome c [Thalassomonas sp. M1454]